MARRKRTVVETAVEVPKWLDWSQVQPEQPDPKSARSWSLRLEVGGVYRVRLIGHPISCFRYYVNGKGAITLNPETCPITTKHNLRPMRRYAINAIDRAMGRVQIIEAPLSLFLAFRRFRDEAGDDPGGPNGPDFDIHVIGGRNRTTYCVSYDAQKRTPFTDAEKDMIREGMFDLTTIYRATANDEIEKRLGLAG
jgi:hypothetical protein